MIQDLFLWSFNVSLLLLVMYGGYWLLFRHNTHFQLRRIILLGCLLLACSVPFIEVEAQLPWSNPIELSIASMTSEPAAPVNTTYTISSSEQLKTIGVTTDFSWVKLFLNIYLVGLLIALGLFLFEITKLSIWYYYGARRTDIQDNVITHKGIKYPFSFWKWIFIPQGTDYDQDIWEIIEKHETAHLNQYHTFDMLFVNLIQCLLWYNPIAYLIQKELKENHEALADQSVLNTTDFKTYAQALVRVSINSSALKLGHSFALISTLSKRITAMQKQKTTFKKTLASVFTLIIIASATVGVNVLKAQNTEESREEALKNIRNRGMFSFSYFPQLTEKHQNVLNRLKKVYPHKEIKHSYSQSADGFEYLERYEVDRTPLFFDKLSEDDKKQLSDIVQKDTVSFAGYSLKSDPKSKFSFPLTEFKKEISEAIDENANYIVFYEPLKQESGEIFDISEVDIKPEPVGGVNSFVKAIALAMDLPKGINKKDLPASIDFEMVIDGGRNISGVNLITELEGTDEENKALYLFFGDVYNTLKSKVSEFYVWKRGIKDDKEVRVRTTIAIPTKYMR